MYKIMRFFSDGRRPRRVMVVSSLELARLHCNSPLTRGALRSGVKWFDGYTITAAGRRALLSAQRAQEKADKEYREEAGPAVSEFYGGGNGGERAV